MISESIVWWGLAATLLFWSVGAYNRLVRLRSHASRMFAALALLLQRYGEVLDSCGMAKPGELRAEEVHTLSSAQLQAWASLYDAQAQFSASLLVARTRPLDGAAIGALGAADQVLQMAWHRLVAEIAPDSAGLEGLRPQWDDVHHQVRHASLVFAQAIQNYNHAIHQFPAVLLAWLFGFHAAKSL
ncbi:LemA family protein [Rhodoferax sp.]|uniref:LemA family protein n=1 Tax=Rhodoferax sp. TaxID=50421 RepID=UPI00374D01B8